MESFNPDMHMYSKKTNAYMTFSSKNRSRIRKRFPSLNSIEITRKLGKMWKNLDDKSAQKYKDEAAKINYEHASKKIHDLNLEVEELKSKLKQIQKLTH